MGRVLKELLRQLALSAWDNLFLPNFEINPLCSLDCCVEVLLLLRFKYIFIIYVDSFDRISLYQPPPTRYAHGRRLRKSSSIVLPPTIEQKRKYTDFG
jgi:hypothetical protein